LPLLLKKHSIFEETIIMDVLDEESGADITVLNKALKLMFESGSIKKMTDIMDMQPSKIASALNINYGRFVKKLFNTGSFRVKEVIAFEKLLGVTPNAIMKVVMNNASEVRPVPKELLSPTKK
jgi:hypothetical protein